MMNLLLILQPTLKSQLMWPKICYFDLNRKLLDPIHYMFSFIRPSFSLSLRCLKICVRIVCVFVNGKTCWRLNEVRILDIWWYAMFSWIYDITRAFPAQWCEYLLIFSGHNHTHTKILNQKKSWCEWERTLCCNIQ